MAYLIKADGNISEVKPANGKKFTLQELQGFVGGYIEIINTQRLNTGEYMVVHAEQFLEKPLDNDLGQTVIIEHNSIMVINEEGKLEGLPVNAIASEMYVFGQHDRIVGDVVISKRGEM